MLGTMMIYGMFVFMRQTTPYETLEQSKSWRHVSNARVGTVPGWQYTGPGEDRITLSGALYPEVTGGDVSLSLLDAMGCTARPWPLIEGTGRIFGQYLMLDLTVTRSEFFSDGKARRIEFSLTLIRTDKSLKSSLSDITYDDLMEVMNCLPG